MKIEYALSKDDYLLYYLYTASKSKTINKNRVRALYIPPVFYILLGVFLSFSDKSLTGVVIFGLTSILWIIIYPGYQKKRYKNYYSKYIDEKYAEIIDSPNEIEFYDENILTKNKTGESKIKTTELKKLIQFKNHFIFELNDKNSFILPKTSIDNESEFLSSLKKYDLEYIDEIQWEWK